MGEDTFWNANIQLQLNKEKECFKKLESHLVKDLWVAIKDGKIISQNENKEIAFSEARQKVGLSLFYFTQVGNSDDKLCIIDSTN